MRRWSGERWFGVGLTVAYAAWVLYVAPHHEPWRDEADVWLATRDMSPRELFRWLGAVGSPGLWYLAVMGLSRAGMPYISMTMLHALLAVCVAGVVAFGAPFSRLVRVLIVFSYHFVYGYAVVARSYVLTVLILFLVASLWRGRRRPLAAGGLLFLLFNTNAHGFLIAGVILLATAAQSFRRREWSRAAVAGLCLAAAGGVLAFVQLLPPPNAQLLGGNEARFVIPEAAARAFVPYFRRPDGSSEWLWLLSGKALPGSAAKALYVLGVLLGAATITAVVCVLLLRPGVLFVFATSVLALLYIFVFKWFGYERHAGLILVMVLFALWASAPTAGAGADAAGTARRIAMGTLVAALVISCVAGFDACMNDVANQFSGSREAAAFIRDHGLEDAVIAGFPDGHASAVLAYLKPQTRFWYVGRRDFGSYMVWDNTWYRNFLLTPDAVLARVEQRFPDHNVLLLMAGRLIPDPELHGYRLIYRGSARVYGSDEYYLLYAPLGATIAP